MAAFMAAAPDYVEPPPLRVARWGQLWAVTEQHAILSTHRTEAEAAPNTPGS
jgi:hypothetical protein